MENSHRPATCHPGGCRLSEFELAATEEQVIHLSDYRDRTNLLLIVSDASQASGNLLSAAAFRYEEIRNEDAEVLAIMALSAKETGKRQNL